MSKGRGEGSRNRAFTTIELMVTLVIIALTSAVVVVSMGPTLRDAEMRSGCRMVISAMNYARSYAVTRQTYTRVALDKGRGILCVYRRVRLPSGEEGMLPITTPSGRSRRLPEGLTIVEILKPGVPEEETYVTFTELGRSEDAIVTLADSRGRERRITVDSITGRCAIETDRQQ